MVYRPPVHQFKGMRRFSYYEDEAVFADARRSPYYWWWAYLRLSKDYWWVCQRRGIADDARLRDMYRDFGDVYAYTFKQWWNKRGQDLFRESVKLPEVRRLDGRALELSKDFDKFMLVEIPLHLTERTITRQVAKLLRNHEERLVVRTSTAKRTLAKYVRNDLGMIQIAHEVWRRLYHPGLLFDPQPRIGVVQGAKSQYEVGLELRLVGSCMPRATDTPAMAESRKNGMKVAVSRMKTRATNLITNAAVGRFPVIKTCTEPVTWRESQQRRLQEAIFAGAWRPLFDEYETLKV